MPHATAAMAQHNIGGRPQDGNGWDGERRAGLKRVLARAACCCYASGLGPPERKFQGRPLRNGIRGDLGIEVEAGGCR